MYEKIELRNKEGLDSPDPWLQKSLSLCSILDNNLSALLLVLYLHLL